MLLGRAWSLAALAVPAAIFPLVPNVSAFWVVLFTYIWLYSLVAMGLVVLTGVGGLTSLGQAMFVGLSAYTTAILTTRYGLSPWLTLPFSVLLTGLLAFLIGLITLRLSGHYLAVATIAWNIGFFYTAANLDLFGRYDGISGIPPIAIGSFLFVDSIRFYYLALAAVVLAAVATQNLLRSRIGRSIRSLKGSVVAAETFGVDPARTKRIAFVFAAVLAAVSGWLYAHMQRSVNPTPFDIEASIEYLLMTVVGGGTQVWGAIAGAAIVTILKDQLQNILPRLIGHQGNYETIVFGGVLVLLLQTLPDGLWGLISRLRPAAGVVVRPESGAGVFFAARPRQAAGTPLVEATGLRRSFGELIAVNDISLSIGAGEIVSVVGPNGAGKSTTFNMMTGVDRIDSGRLFFAQREITNLTSREIAGLGLARTFQHVRLISAMSVIENVAIGAHLRGGAGSLRAVFGLDRAEERCFFGEAARQLDRVGLSNEALQPTTSLPLGQQRITEIARALCLDPLVLFLDEPAAGLRHQEKVRLASLLKSLRDEGMAILLVEHDMDFVMGLSDRVVVVNFGSKLAEGLPADIVRDPAVIEAYLGTSP